MRLPLTWREVETLAAFNAEVARGVVHTSRQRIRMAALQWRYGRFGWLPDTRPVRR